MKDKYIVSYDISDDKRRRKFVKIIEDYGIRWQFSVFLCEFTVAEKKEFNTKIKKVINSKKDSVISIPTSPQTLERTEVIGVVDLTKSINKEPSFF